MVKNNSICHCAVPRQVCLDPLINARPSIFEPSFIHLLLEECNERTCKSIDVIMVEIDIRYM